jgi:DNA-binding IclR family transcriptional regulator
MGRASLYEFKRDGILEVIRRLSASGRAPSLREVASVADVSVATLHSYLKRMADEGLVEWHSKSHRSLRLTEPSNFNV